MNSNETVSTATKHGGERAQRRESHLGFLLVVLAMAASALLSLYGLLALIVWLICLAFGLAFSWLVPLALWAALLVAFLALALSGSGVR